MHKKIIRDTVYYYTSVRENGRIKTIYLGRTEEEALRKEGELKKTKAAGTLPADNTRAPLARKAPAYRLPLYFAVVFFIIIGLLFIRGTYVGYVSLTGPEKFMPLDMINGSIAMTLKSGEFYPMDAIIEAGIGNDVKKMQLYPLVEQYAAGTESGSGDYLIMGSNISGSGDGFGIASGNENDVDFSIPVEDFGISAPEEPGDYVFVVRLLYNQTIISDAEKNITVAEADSAAEPEMLPDAQPGIETPEIDVKIPKINVSFYCDADSDGYYSRRISITCEKVKCVKEHASICSLERGDDCDDSKPEVKPGAEEICENLIDDDCDGFDKACTTLTETISRDDIDFVSKELVNEIENLKKVRVRIKLKDSYVTGKEPSEIAETFKSAIKVKNYVSSSMNELEIIVILRDHKEDIEAMEVDHRLNLFLEEAVNATGVTMVWDANVTGKGQTVCIVDSGIDYNHPNLSASYIGGYNFIGSNSSDPMDDLGHGTYVAGIVAGIAKDAKIVAAKVFGEDGSGYESDILAGIDYCIRNKDTYNISVILMAFGGGIYNTSCYCDSNIIANESNFAASRGILPVAASGNDGLAYLKAPACGTSVTSVGATDDYDDVANFTNIEPLLDLLAPGVNVTSPKMGGGYETRSGTSASAAVVAGIAALLKENDNLAPPDMQYVLRSTGVMISHNGTAYPRIDAYAAFTNSTTNEPAIHEGTQCESEWEEYEPASIECDISCAPCNTGCDNKCYVEGCSVTENTCAICYTWGEYRCDTSYCGATCDVVSGCPDTCVLNTLYTGRTCNTACSSCSCSAGSATDCLTLCADGCVEYTGCSGGVCTYSGGDCGSYTCSGGACTSTCSQACGAACDADNDCTSDYCAGTCGTGADSCAWRDYYCTAACACTYDGYDADTTTGRCTGCSQNWNTGGSGDCTGESGCTTACCGDDSGEKYRYCQAASGFPDAGDCIAGDNTCCDLSTDCVTTDGNTCVTSGSTATDGDGDGNNDYCLSGTWYDCSTDPQCATGYTCISNNCVASDVINGGTGTTCDGSNPCFYIKDSGGTVKARFDDNGYIDIKGSYNAGQGGTLSCSSCFQVKNSAGTLMLYVDSSGNMYTKGYFYKQTTPAPSGGDDFIIKDSGGTVAGFIDGATGNLYFKGQLHYSSSF
ncbi:MAG: S8 family serine peptidase [Candidatus Aenigmarchaeota archaeon]|nr:S8 family serine peptidase [Candidatus Aenigmarchaeota archaeon]